MALIIALMVARLLTAVFTELSPDEAYYWLWAQHPDTGYYDHPPFVAWAIWASTAVFGDSAFAVRLPALLSFAVVMWAMWDAGRAAFSADISRRVVLWLNASLLLSVGTVIATPDPFSALFWALGVWALARLIVSGNGQWWLAVGAFAGLGVLAKYTNLFFGLGLVLWLLADRDARRWLLRPWPYLGGVIAVIVMVPNLIWNLQHDWATVIKQFGRVDDGGLTLAYLPEVWLSQALLFNPLILVFAVLGGIAAFAKGADSRLKMLILTALPLLVYMVWHSLHDRVQGNWPAPVYAGLILLAAVVAEGIQDGKFARVRALAAPLGIALTLVGLAVILSGGNGLMQGWGTLAQQAEALRRQAGAEAIATTDYNTQGQLSFHLEGQDIVPLHERERYHWLPNAPRSGQRVLILTQARHNRDLDALITDPTPVGDIPHGDNAKNSYRAYVGTVR